MTTSGIVVENLAAFRSDLRAALGAAPRELSAAIKAAGVPVQSRASSLAPQRTGRLAASYRISVRGSTGSVTSSAPYGGGAEWGRRGKWSGFTRYGAPGERFAGKAVADKEDEIARILDEGLREIIEIRGWAR
jgi:hypothetical protein